MPNSAFERPVTPCAAARGRPFNAIVSSSPHVAGTVARISTLVVVLVSAPIFASAADVASVFHDGVFEVRGGTPLKTLTSIYPSGDTLPSMEERRVIYRVKDDRT